MPEQPPRYADAVDTISRRMAHKDIAYAINHLEAARRALRAAPPDIVSAQEAINQTDTILQSAYRYTLR